MLICGSLYVIGGDVNILHDTCTDGVIIICCTATVLKGREGGMGLNNDNNDFIIQGTPLFGALNTLIQNLNYRNTFWF